MIRNRVVISFDMANIGCELRYIRQVPFLSRRPGCRGGHDQSERLVVRVDYELPPLDHVAEVLDRFLNPEELLVKSGILVLCCRQLSREKSQRSSVFLS